MSEVFSILLHNRQRYEQGKEGLWFSLPTTTEKLQEALREIGISADNPQDFFLYDYRSPQERPITAHFVLHQCKRKGDYCMSMVIHFGFHNGLTAFPYPYFPSVLRM